MEEYLDIEDIDTEPVGALDPRHEISDSAHNWLLVHLLILLATLMAVTVSYKMYPTGHWSLWMLFLGCVCGSFGFHVVSVLEGFIPTKTIKSEPRAQIRR